jgi:hypothetical protein
VVLTVKTDRIKSVHEVVKDDPRLMAGMEEDLLTEISKEKPHETKKGSSQAAAKKSLEGPRDSTGDNVGRFFTS